MRGIKLRNIPTIFVTVFVLSVFAHCNDSAAEQKYLTVDFQKGQTLRYKFVSGRVIDMDWGRMKGSKAGKEKLDRSTESMEMVVAYTPIEVEPYGLTTVKATCESVKVTRSRRAAGTASARKDAAEHLVGKSFTFSIDAAGRIDDYSQLNQLIRQIGEKAFRPNRSRGRIKEPDMIGDFIATQRFLWDSISGIERPAEGVSVGQTWKSELSVPTPMVSRKARDVSYTLDEIRPTEKGQLAVISSRYKLAESAPANWPIPYTGRFQMSSTFGFLSRYKYLDLQGQGEELFNIDAGRTEKYSQEYRLQTTASGPFGIGGNVSINIKQYLTMQLLECDCQADDSS